MGTKIKFHLEGLHSKQVETLKQMSPFMQEHGFYLAGGTALSVYFGHRISVDLAWFTSNPIEDVQLLVQDLRESHLDFLAQQTGPGTLHGIVSDVRVSFIEYRYPLLQVPVFWEEISCSLASLEDLACMKLSAIAQRGARKDFCDIYALGDYSTAAKAAWLLRIAPRLSSPRANMFKAAFSSRSIFNPQAGQS